MNQPVLPQRPLVGPERSFPEITVKAVMLGVALSMLMAAANAYLGLRVGMTVAASIPASAIALGVLRAFRRSNIRENNQVQTIASAGASTVSGIIFTVPALVMMGAWSGYDYWPIFLMVFIGGVKGVVFTTPQRRALIVDTGLLYPEGVATAEVLKTGSVQRDESAPPAEQSKAGALGFKLLLEASVIGAVFKVLEGGVKWFAGEVGTAKALFGGSWLFKADATLAPSLLGIGFIVGPNIGTLVKEPYLERNASRAMASFGSKFTSNSDCVAPRVTVCGKSKSSPPRTCQVLVGANGSYRSTGFIVRLRISTYSSAELSTSPGRSGG